MLYEKIIYDDDFPINITISEIEKYPLHYHKDTEFVYVLSGEIELQNGYCSYILKEGDIFTNSGHEVHGLRSTGKHNLVAVIQISNWFFTRYFPSLNTACYRTFSPSSDSAHLDPLRRMLLTVLSDYLMRNFSYKRKCISGIYDAISYINTNFNLFTFDGRTVVNFKDMGKEENPVNAERISRIINYVYENHASAITLSKLADLEHLSPYYISHLIREYIGISFQEFLCFARVEMSAAALLGTDKKISTIARETGFSATSYYEKYFLKWFQKTPEDYRKTYGPEVLSPENPPVMSPVSQNLVIHTVKTLLSSFASQDKNPSGLSKIKEVISVKDSDLPVSEISSDLEILVTAEDYRVMGAGLFSSLSELRPETAVLSAKPSDSPEEISQLRKMLESAGFKTAIEDYTEPVISSAYGFDSIAAMFWLIRENLSEKGKIKYRLRDQGDSIPVLRGIPSCFTSCKIPKPAFSACSLLSRTKASLIRSDKNYYLLRNGDTYIVILLNYSEDIYRLCLHQSTLYETSALFSSFTDEVSLSFSFELPEGFYGITKYTFSDENNIFSYMAQLRFPKNLPVPEAMLPFAAMRPDMHAFVKKSSGTCDLTFNLKGAGVQIILIAPVCY